MSFALTLSEKYKSFLETDARMEFLEGTTYAGKTTVAVYKFMKSLEKSSRKQHIISGLDVGTVEKNIIHKDKGILSLFEETAAYNAGKAGKHSIPHIAFSPSAEKGDSHIIYVLGYADRTRWKKVLGGQFGSIFVDELNIADIDFVRECSIRSQYFLATLNPDNPSLEVYSEYVNQSKPLNVWKNETPNEILSELSDYPKENWVHWYFSFKDNLSLSEEKKNEIINSVPKDTKIYKNKILGLRGRSTGLVFNLDDSSLISAEDAQNYKFVLFTCGVDTSYSQKTDDSFAFVFTGFTQCGKKITLDIMQINNKNNDKPVTPSDIPMKIYNFLEKNREAWGFAREVYIDSADSATILECQKYQKENGIPYLFIPAYKSMKILDRINLQGGWLARKSCFIVKSCKGLIDEMNTYSWKDDNIPEDRNDHLINAEQYSWIPHAHLIK